MHIIYIIDNDEELSKKLKEEFENDKDYRFKQIKTSEIEIVLKDIPALTIVNEDKINNAIEICNNIREDENNTITPVIVLTSNLSRENKLEVLKGGATYCIKNPIDFSYLYYTIKNIINLLYVNRKVSPLTSLPGNVQIQAEMKRRLLKKEFFAMLYFDLDNFKAYNDIYGFSNGDEIIKFTAHTITNNVYANDENNNFVGHVGGDDFVAIIEDKNYEKICQNIIIQFDNQVKKYFSKKDIEKGYLEVPNRRGIIEEFPLTTISIGVVEVEKNRFKNTLEIGEVGAQVKHLSKTIQGSTYVIDKRK